MGKTASVPPPFGINSLTKYICGATRLGDARIPFAERVKIAWAAI